MPQSKLSFLISFRFIYPKCAWLKLNELIIEIIIMRTERAMILTGPFALNGIGLQHFKTHKNYRFSWLVCTIFIRYHNFPSAQTILMLLLLFRFYNCTKHLFESHLAFLYIANSYCISDFAKRKKNEKERSK